MIRNTQLLTSNVEDEDIVRSYTNLKYKQLLTN
nr:MAG TPA: hypothetical protein [Caudoviricetes sp.]